MNRHTKYYVGIIIMMIVRRLVISKGKFVVFKNKSESP